MGTRPEAAQVPRRRHAGSWPPAWLNLELARPETAGRAPRDLTSRTRATVYYTRIPVSGLLVIDAVGWRSMYFVVMPRVDCIVIFLTYHVYLYSINCPTVICLPSMYYFILWRDTASELWTPVLFPSYCYHLFTLLALFTILAYFHCFPLDMLIPFVSSKPVRLTTSS
jgi:hypothetical protein